MYGTLATVRKLSVVNIRKCISIVSVHMSWRSVMGEFGFGRGSAEMTGESDLLRKSGCCVGTIQYYSVIRTTFSSLGIFFSSLAKNVF